MNKAAVFDLDGTLLPGTSAERLLVPYLLKAGVIGTRHLGSALSAFVTVPVRGYRWAVRANKRYLKGVAVEEAVQHVGEFVEGVLMPRLCLAVLDRLDALRSQGYITLLLTGAPDPIARAVVRCLRMTDGVGTALETRAGRLTGHIDGTHYFGAAKRSGVAELVARHCIDLTGSFAFADHASDVAFLECFGHPVAVRARRALRREALLRGWQLLDP